MQSSWVSRRRELQPLRGTSLWIVTDMGVIRILRYVMVVAQIGLVLFPALFGYIHSFWLMTSLCVIVYATFLAKRSD